MSFSEEEKIQLNVWDTSGAERFDSLTKLYYRDAQVGCLVVIGFFTFVVARFFNKKVLKIHPSVLLVYSIIFSSIIHDC